MEKKDIIDFLKEEICIEWLEALNRFIKSHIEYVKCMNDLENQIKKEQN